MTEEFVPVYEGRPHDLSAAAAEVVELVEAEMLGESEAVAVAALLEAAARVLRGEALPTPVELPSPDVVEGSLRAAYVTTRMQFLREEVDDTNFQTAGFALCIPAVWCRREEAPDGDR